MLYLKNSFVFRGHLCLAFDELNSSILTALQSYEFTLGDIKIYAKNLCIAFKLLAQHGIIHVRQLRHCGGAGGRWVGGWW